MEPPNDGIAWRPSPEHIQRSRLSQLVRRLGCTSADDLRQRAAADPTWFWAATIEDLGIRWTRPPSQVVDLSNGKPWATWFPGAGFNYTTSAIDRWADGHSADGTAAAGVPPSLRGKAGEGAQRRVPAPGRGLGPALIWEGEDGAQRSLTYRQLLAEVSRAANALKALGVGKGDRVGIFMPLTLECAVATLACGRIGAIFTPMFSGYGAGAVATRLMDSGARLLITVDGFFRRGQFVPMKATADEALRAAPSVEKVLVLRRTGSNALHEHKDLGGAHPTTASLWPASRLSVSERRVKAGSPLAGGAEGRPLGGGEVPWQPGRDVWWHELVPAQPADCPAADTDANDPYMIIYTSGTTGRPKGTRHVHAGFPIKAAADQAQCFDVQLGDRVFWYSDIGWMMAPWLIQGTLLLGATAFLYDGAPDWPGPDRIWDLVERHQITLLGISPTAIRALMRHDVDQVRRHALHSLRALGSSGETWNPDAWWWFFREVGASRCPIINYSGGTEVSGGIVSGTTIEPLKPCAFAGPVPGMAADVVDDDGRSVCDQVGELVVRQPWVGMTQGFWGGPPGEDPARESAARQRYLETYWSRLPETWVHGDWALVDAEGSWYIHGRSDDTIKVAGKRVGPAEVESAAAGHPAVAEAAAVGVPHELKGEDVALFCVLRPSYQPSAALGDEIAATVVAHLGRALRPGQVRFIRELPKTRNAKVMRRVIRAVCRGDADLGDLTGLENPAAVDAIRDAVRSGTPGG